ncbi:MAG: hypothetical protein J0I42_18860 [Bosea sp.]|uniref:hypothetical protein n=1 Tax=Bosea sp. (in: a-proteobacteria) TaxID=1871050 RepID=UPI001AC61BEE|nr:hypothetical protein [Bosea sp. (in: a-proteobacteria)]MBN9454003.1 hypothetical protein [Bosea sp. (in: a-proteobacteria)]
MKVFSLEEARDRLLKETGPVKERDWLVPQATASSPTNRPALEFNETRPDLAIRKAAEVLLEAGLPLYLRLGRLVWLREVASKDWERKPLIVKRFADEAMKENLRDELSQLTDWRGRNGKAIPVPPPVYNMMPELAWKLGVVPEVEGLFMAPTLRPDGTVLLREGYDAATRLLLVDVPRLPAIPDRPSRADAEAALVALKGLLREFPFRDEADQSVALALILATVVRGALGHIPLTVIQAPEKGSGKSFLVDIANVIATGQRCSVVAARSEVEKWERQIALSVASGDPIVSLDNFNGELKSDLLAQLVTQTKVKALLPYGRDMVELECRSVLTVNGNGVRVADDLGRRVVLCRLDAGMERPWERAFEGRPLDEIGRNRGRYIAAALTIVRAYLAAGEPVDLEPLNGFEDWGRFVRGPLVWLGQVDPAATQANAMRDDTGLQSLGVVFAAMAEACGVGEDNARTLNEMLGDAPAGRDGEWARLQDAFAEAVAPKPLTPLSLGHALRKAANRVIGGHRLRNRSNRLGTKEWWIDRA